MRHIRTHSDAIRHLYAFTLAHAYAQRYKVRIMFIDGVWICVSSCEELSVWSLRSSLATERGAKTHTSKSLHYLKSTGRFKWNINTHTVLSHVCTHTVLCLTYSWLCCSSAQLPLVISSITFDAPRFDTTWFLMRFANLNRAVSEYTPGNFAQHIINHWMAFMCRPH